MIGKVTQLGSAYGLLADSEGTVYKFDYSELPNGKIGDRVYFVRLSDTGQGRWATELEKVLDKREDCPRCQECHCKFKDKT